MRKYLGIFLLLLHNYSEANTIEFEAVKRFMVFHKVSIAEGMDILNLSKGNREPEDGFTSQALGILRKQLSSEDRKNFGAHFRIMYDAETEESKKYTFHCFAKFFEEEDIISLEQSHLVSIFAPLGIDVTSMVTDLEKEWEREHCDFKDFLSQLDSLPETQKAFISFVEFVQESPTALDELREFEKNSSDDMCWFDGFAKYIDALPEGPV